MSYDRREHQECTPFNESQQRHEQLTPSIDPNRGNTSSSWHYGAGRRSGSTSGVVGSGVQHSTGPRGWPAQQPTATPYDYHRQPQQHPSPVLGWGGQALVGSQGGRGRGRGRADHAHADKVLAQCLSTIRSCMPGQGCAAAVAPLMLQLDSRSCAVLMKRLNEEGQRERAFELFDSISAAPPEHALSRFFDVWVATSIISVASTRGELPVALRVSQEMVARGVPRNVHTFSALINCAIKAGQSSTALQIWEEMQTAGVPANLVTYNTLIDVYGKLGQWAEAMRILHRMRAEGIEPVVRTYNTLMIACNASNQWQEALHVYQLMLAAGMQPNTTTYNALVSAYSKAGQLDKVMEVFQDMVRAGCERSVITYSALISAAEKAGQWELALGMFNRMAEDGVRPNTITFNSLLAALGQGAQWEQASEVFEQMQRQGCQPDVLTYTVMISAYGRAAQWRRALQAFERMQRTPGLQPDAIAYDTVVEALWDTGILSAQRKATQLHRRGTEACSARGFALPQSPRPGPSLAQLAPGLAAAGTAAAGSSVAAGLAVGSSRSGTLPMPAMGLGPGQAGLAVPGGAAVLGLAARVQAELFLGFTAGSVAFISLLCWLADIGDMADRDGVAALPERLVLRLGAPRGRQREVWQGMGSIRTAAPAWLAVHKAPFRLTPETPASSTIRYEASRAELAAWLAEGKVRQELGPYTAAASLQLALHGDLDLTQEMALEVRCGEAFEVVRRFEATHCLNVPAMGPAYVAARQNLVMAFLKAARRTRLPAEHAFDAVLLMDRWMSSGRAELLPSEIGTGVVGSRASTGFLALLLTSLLVVVKQADTMPLQAVLAQGLSPVPQLQRPSQSAVLVGAVEALAVGLGVAFDSLAHHEARLRIALAGDTSSTSCLHSLRLFCLRLGMGMDLGLGVEGMEPLAEPDPLAQVQAAAGSLAATGVAPEPAAAAAAAQGDAGPGQAQVEGQTLEEAFAALAMPTGSAGKAAARGSGTAGAGAPSSAAASGVEGRGGSGQPAPEGATALGAAGEAGSTVPSGGSGSGVSAGLPRATGAGGSSGGGQQGARSGPQAPTLKNVMVDLLGQAVASNELLNYRPSIVAAAALYMARVQQGVLPLWPTSLASLTGTHETLTPEFFSAISAMRKLMRF